MGQKVSPHGMRLGINKDWDSKWYPSNKSDWAVWFHEDVKIRDFIFKHEREWGIGRLIIEKTSSYINIIIHTARPAIILGENGTKVKQLEKDIERHIKNNSKSRRLKIEVIEILKPELNARIIANEIAIAIENRAPFRTAQKFAIRKVLRAGGKGIKTQVSGRLGGAEMARTEGYTEGVIPNQTLRQDIDYATARASTTYGALGIKVWINKGEILDKKRTKELKKDALKENIGGEK